MPSVVSMSAASSSAFGSEGSDHAGSLGADRAAGAPLAPADVAPLGRLAGMAEDDERLDVAGAADLGRIEDIDCDLSMLPLLAAAVVGLEAAGAAPETPPSGAAAAAVMVVPLAARSSRTRLAFFCGSSSTQMERAASSSAPAVEASASNAAVRTSPTDASVAGRTRERTAASCFASAAAGVATAAVRTNLRLACCTSGFLSTAPAAASSSASLRLTQPELPKAARVPLTAEVTWTFLTPPFSSSAGTSLRACSPKPFLPTALAREPIALAAPPMTDIFESPSCFFSTLATSV